MQLKFATRLLSALACCAISACNPWFDRAPPLAGQNSVANPQACPAKDLQYLVGQSRTVLYTMRFGSEVRFEEPGQAYTQEFKATRTRIIMGADGKIVRILCG
jgi:hypothetical protein